MPERRLAAIGVLDVVGYSSMMAEDEEGTLATLRAHRNALDPILLNHGGRIVKGTGDGMLVEVPSAVEAVKAAIEMQQTLAERNASVPDGRQMQMRIGINLGDVIVEDDGDVFGDGVNVAARLEALADPGGVCVSGSIYNQVAGRVECEFDDLGDQEVKGIPRPIRAYRVSGFGEAVGKVSGAPALATPTIAVFPFENRSDDPDSEYFAEGISDDLITALSHLEALQVSSRAGSFSVHKRGLDLRDAARDLDAAYIIDGTVRQVGNRVRVTAHLVEAETGTQIWGERYDREMTDIFALQDEIVEEVLAQIRPNVERREIRKKGAVDVAELEAHDVLLRARQKATDGSESGVKEAIAMLEATRDRYPDVASVHTELAGAWVALGFNRWRLEGRRAFDELAMEAAEAVRLDPMSARAAAIYSLSESYAGRSESAANHSRRAIALSPHEPFVLLCAGQVMNWSGDHTGGIELLSEAWTRARFEPWRYHIATNLAFAHYLEQRYEPALAWAQTGQEAADYLQTRMLKAAALARLGLDAEARAQAERIKGDWADVSLAAIRRHILWQQQDDIDHYLEGLAMAGLSE